MFPQLQVILNHPKLRLGQVAITWQRFDHVHKLNLCQPNHNFINGLTQMFFFRFISGFENCVTQVSMAITGLTTCISRMSREIIVARRLNPNFI